MQQSKQCECIKGEMMKTYSDLMKLSTFEDSYKYLKLGGIVGKETFGTQRYLNQKFYTSDEWKRIRNHVILRDNGCDLAVPGRELYQRIYIHHLNPITPDDILQHSDCVIDPEFLICCSYNTHQAIHYGDESLLFFDLVERKPFDTCPWRT